MTTWCQAPVRGRRLRSIAAVAAVLTLGACDFPTEAPIFQSRYVVPTDNTTLSVNQLLPSSVTLVNGAFRLALAPVTLTRTLGVLCPTCVPVNGQPVPYPGFTASLPLVVDLPADVASAVLASGAVNVSITNNFGFDPLNPPGFTTGGTMTITIANGSRTLGTGTITGPFPAGATRVTPIALAPGTVAGPINVSVAINSPPGGLLPSQFVTMDANSTIFVNAVSQAITVSSANVAITGKSVAVDAIDLDLSDIDASLGERAVGGAIILKMTNPFAVTGTLQLRITGGGVNITKSVAIAPGTTTQRVEFTGPELRSMLGKRLVLSISGPVNSSGVITVTPGQVLNIETSLDLVVQIGGTVN